MFDKNEISGPKAPGAGELSYNSYLKIPELLQLQHPQSEPAHHDELLFIIIHQSYELWFKLIRHEVCFAMEYLKQGDAVRATYFVKRVSEVLRNLVPQIHILETMAPSDFLKFRSKINPASGFQSVQFRQLEFMLGLKDERYLAFFKKDPQGTAELEKTLKEEDLREVAYDFFKEAGHDIRADVKNLDPVYYHPAEHYKVYHLCEALVDVDEYLGLWRDHHVRVVERIIGSGKKGTGGSDGVAYLRTTLNRKCFPELWMVRTTLL